MTWASAYRSLPVPVMYCDVVDMVEHERQLHAMHRAKLASACRRAPVEVVEKDRRAGAARTSARAIVVCRQSKRRVVAASCTAAKSPNVSCGRWDFVQRDKPVSPQHRPRARCVSPVRAAAAVVGGFPRPVRIVRSAVRHALGFIRATRMMGIAAEMSDATGSNGCEGHRPSVNDRRTYAARCPRQVRPRRLSHRLDLPPVSASTIRSDGHRSAARRHRLVSHRGARATARPPRSHVEARAP